MSTRYLYAITFLRLSALATVPVFKCRACDWWITFLVEFFALYLSYLLTIRRWPCRFRRIHSIIIGCVCVNYPRGTLDRPYLLISVSMLGAYTMCIGRVAGQSSQQANLLCVHNKLPICQGCNSKRHRLEYCILKLLQDVKF